MMFRAPARSNKPRLRIDAEPERWQSLRDDLCALSLEHGPTWLELAERVDVCPEMSGREFEKWQPLLALAAWIESCGANGLLKLMQAHALATIEDNATDGTPDCDETLLRSLADEVRAGHAPTPGELLACVKEADPDAFRNWTPRAASEHLKRYGLATYKSHGRKVYGRIALADLQKIQTSYGVDLGFCDTEEEAKGDH